MSATAADPALALLRDRCARLPAALVALHRDPPRWPPLPDGSLVVTGVGGSEGPARLLVALLQQRGRAARFAPLSSFLGPRPPVADGLVIFSQGLSPNATLALAHAPGYRASRLVTALPPDSPALGPHLDRGLGLVHVPGDDEGGLLARLLGPARASLAAMLLAGPCMEDKPSAHREDKTSPGGLSPPCPQPVDSDRLAAALAAASSPAEPVAPGLLALVSAGEAVARYEGLRWLLLEGMLRPCVALWDALAVAHGPFQGFHTEPITLLALESPDGLTPDLTDRLAAMLRPHHHLRRLPATLPGPWSLLEHTVSVAGLLVASLEAHPVPLQPWPGQGEDGALYRLGTSPIPSLRRREGGPKRDRR